MAHHPESHETLDRLRTLAPPPDFQPDVTRARARLLARETRARRRARVLVVGAAACLGVVMLPGPRALARSFWSQWIVGRLTVIQTPAHVPDEVAQVFEMTSAHWDERPVRDLREAETLAGFRPILPPADVLKGDPRLSVVKHVTLTASPLDVATIERALLATGVTDVTVPPEWQGVTLRADGGPMVVADYEGMSIMQLAPFSMSASSRVQFGRFMEMALRVFGRSESEARALGEKFEANPALVLHFPRETPVREVTLAAGTGILVPSPDGSGGVCFFWNTSDRIFIADADVLNDEDAIALANAMQ